MTNSGLRPPDTPPIPCSVWFGPAVTVSEERAFIEHLVSEHGVGVCCWPRDARRIEHLAAAGVPCLLLVGPGVSPPPAAPRQAWVRPSAGMDEIHVALVELCDGAAR